MMDLVCIFAALLFFTANLLEIIAESMRKSHHDANYEALHELDPDYLSQQWLDGDMKVRSLFLASGVIKTAAWLAFVGPILQVAWILSSGGKRKLGTHVMLSTYAVGGTMGELISRLMIIGSYSASHWVADTFNLDNWTTEGGDQIGWRTLQVVYIVVEGAILWIDAFEWLALFGIMCCMYYSVVTLPDENRVIGLWLVRLGLLIGILCLFDFAADILRFTTWSPYSKIALLISILNSLVLLPMWLIMLSIQLPGAKPKHVPGEDEEAFVGNGSGNGNGNHVM